MSLLISIRQKLHRFFLKRKISKQSYAHKTINLSEAKSISILFDADQQAEADQIISWANELKKSGKDVQLLAYLPYKLKEYTPPYPYFTNKSINWLFFPVSEQVEQFTNNRCDILCCLFIKENLTLESIAAMSNAQFRVGKFSEGKTYCFDFMINLDKNASVAELIPQMKHFLNKIKLRRNVSTI
ncbi:MAG: hypothetical protein WD048_08980 [Chitinophagales bacterium]